MILTRRILLLGAPLFLASCATRGGQRNANLQQAAYTPDPYYVSLYGGIEDDRFPVQPVNLAKVPPKYWRREVAYETAEQPGTIVVDPNQRFLYLVQENGRAIRYGVGVGKTEAFNFQGEATISRKAEWPRWTPTPDMIRRDPELNEPYRNGMPGGVDNPLGARALYLYRDGRDTLYRLHGTTNPATIGTKVSSGCVRLMNQDIIDLCNRVPTGTKVIVLPSASAPEEAPLPDMV